MDKKIIMNQKYEDYWKITLEYTDIYGKPFNCVLRIIVDFIDNKVDKNIGITKENYKDLQLVIKKIYNKNDISIRKSINQFFKLGFINNLAKGYHSLTKAFLNETDKEQKRIIFSKIVYDNSSFSRSYDHAANTNEMKFLLKTLEVCGTINKKQLLAIMFTDINEIEKGYLNSEELKVKCESIDNDKTEERKYNQRDHLLNVCTKLTNIYADNSVLYLDSNINIENKEKVKVRDAYLQRLYKNELINESKKIFDSLKGKCVLEKLAYPILIASHIKPYVKCDEKEAFDVNNGLLLSKNMDSLFDNGYITFDESGNIIASKNLDVDVVNYVSKFKLPDNIYNEKRKEYMDYHRKFVFYDKK